MKNFQNFNKAFIDKNKVYLQFPYDERIKTLIKENFRFRIWNKDKKRWELTIKDRSEVFKIRKILKEFQFQIIGEGDLNLSNINEIEFFDEKPEFHLFLHPDCLPSARKILHFFKSFITFEDKRFKFFKIFLTKKSFETLIALIKQKQIFVTPEIEEKILNKYKIFLSEIEKSQATFSDIDFAFLNLKKELFPFQKAGVQYLIEKGKVLLADEMGLGKTIQAIVATIWQQAFPSLVITPASLKHNWEKEIIQTADCSVYVIDSKKTNINDLLNSFGSSKNNSENNSEKYSENNSESDYKNNQAILKNNISDFVIINYDILEKFLPVLKEIPFQSLIIDESHYIKNKKAKRTRAVIELSQIIKERNGKIYLLTGTPILNKPNELISQLEVLGVLKTIVRNEFQFLIRYCGGYKDKKGWHFRRATNILELQEKLRSTCMIRRHKKDVLTELPDKIRSLINFEIDNEDYFDLEKEYEDALSEEKIGYIPKLYRLSGIAKIPYVLNWVNNFFENFSNTCKKLVIFAYHQDVQNTLYQMLSKKYKTFKLTSEMSPYERQKVVQEFQNNPEIQVIVVALRVGGEGITLTASDTVLITELYWVPAILQQAEDRLHRISQKSTVSVYYLLAQNTIDMAIWNIMSEKEQLFTALTKGIKIDPEQKEKIDEMIKVIKQYLKQTPKKEHDEKKFIVNSLEKIEPLTIKNEINQENLGNNNENQSIEKSSIVTYEYEINKELIQQSLFNLF